MTVQTIKLGDQKFVIVPEKHYRDLEARASNARSASTRKRSRVQVQGDIAESRRRMKEPGGRTLAEVRKSMGL